MIEIMAGAIELGLFIYMFFLVCRNNTRIQELQRDCVELEKKITKLTKDTKKNHEELMNSFDDKSITIAEGVTDIIETLEDLLNTFKMDEKYFKYHKAFMCDNIEILHDNIQDYAYQIVSLSIETKELMTPEKSAEQLTKIALERIDEIYQKLIETKQVYFCGRLSRRDRKELKILIR